MKLIIVLALSALVASAVSPSAEATITTIAAADVPLSDPSSVFDVSHAGTTYAVQAGTNLNPVPGGYDVRDVFGGTFQSYPPEHGDTVFADQQAIGTVESILVVLPAATSLGRFTLYLGEDGDNSGHRSTRGFRLKTGATTLADVSILDNSGSQSFKSVYGGYVIKIDQPLVGAPAASTYFLDFVQNQSANVASGLRVLEFEAFVPEPGCTCTVIFVLAAFPIARRRRRARLRA
jgi:hypothetical protein